MPMKDITNQLFCIILKNEYAIRSINEDYSCGYECPVISSYIIQKYQVIHVFNVIVNYIYRVCNNDVFEIKLLNECLDYVLAYINEDFEPVQEDSIILTETAT